MLLEEANRLLHQAFLVVKKAKFEGRVGLRLGFVLGLSDVHQLLQVVNGHLHVAVLGVHVREELVGLALLVSRARLQLSLTDFQEVVKLGDCLLKVTKLLIDEADALVALSLLFLVVGALAGLEALLEVL